MSNFSGVQKGGRTFSPKGSGGEDVVIDRVAAGGYEPVHYFEVKKTDQPVLDTTPTPRTDGRGEGEIGLSGSVDHPDNDGGAKYLASKLARVYRQIMSDGADLENLSREQRRTMRDQLIQGVYDGDGQHPSGEAASQGQKDVLTYITAVANVLFGLADEIPGTPEFLTRSDSGTLLKSYGTGVTVYCRILHKNEALREVHGVIAEEVPDKASEILDFASSEPYFRKWSSEAYERTTAAGLPASYGNVREQHSPRAVGKLTSIEFDSANKRIPVVAKIVDDETWRKIQAGVLTGFSIGGSYLNKWSDGNYTRYTAKPAEVSIVDNPCMPGATFSMVKDAPANPELAALRKQLNELKETIRSIIARRAGVVTDSGSSGSRFVTKDAGSSNDPQQLIKTALANGKPAEFKGQVVKSSFIPLDTGEQRNGEQKAREALGKALNNGVNIDRAIRKS